MMDESEENNYIVPCAISTLVTKKAFYSNDHITCELNICEFPLDENVLFSLEEPISDTFSFPNWNTFMGISNKINSSDPYCYPNYDATFIPNDIQSGCKKNKNKFVVKGYWDNLEKVRFEQTSFNIHIQGKIAQCNFDTLDKFYCLYEGCGNIQLDTFYFKEVLTAYRVSSLEKNITLKECESNFINKIKNMIFTLFLFLIL